MRNDMESAGARRSSVIDALDRPRLFCLLDNQMPRNAIWLVAAGGYGKTTLAVSYAESRNLPVIWLSVPEAGLSVGEFFYQLREAAVAAAGMTAASLPVLNPEYAFAADVFVRRFAEQLAACFGDQAFLLLDDLHNLTEDDPLQALIAMLVSALAGRMRVLIASRHEPASAWVGLRSQGQLSFIDERTLAFDKAETLELLTQQGLPTTAVEQLVPQLVETTSGWPVGLMLLLEHWRRTGEMPNQNQQGKTLADWFLQEIYTPLPEADRALLRSCALPALVPLTIAEAVTGVPDADTRLEQLASRHAFIFIDNDGQGSQHYRFHDLFRDFLRQRGRTEEPAVQLAEQSRRWGRQLWQQGWWSVAAPLLVDVQDHEGLSEGIKQAAPMLLQTGCGDKLYGWLLALPEAQRRADPLLRLWEGMCLILLSTVDARSLLSSAWDELAKQHDYVHMAIAWGGIVDSIWLEWGHVSEYERWIVEFLRFEEAFRAHLPAPIWHTVLRGILTAISYGRPTDPSLERWEREAFAALSADLPDTERVMLASQLMYLNTWQFGRRAGASRVMVLMQGQEDAIERASPLARCLWKTFTALWALLFEADRDTCLQEADEGRELIRNYGIGTWDDAVPAVHCALAFKDQAAMDDWVVWFMRTEPKAHRPFYDTFQAHFLSARSWLRGDLQEALDHAREAVAVADQHGSINISATFHGFYAGLLAEAGQFAAALAESRRAREQQQGLPSDFLNVALYLNLAKIPLHRGQPRRMLPYLRRAFEAGERQRLFLPLFVKSEALAMMCGLALAENIAPDYAHWLIKVRGLLPPEASAYRQHWPWNCRLAVLGHFSVDAKRVVGAQQSGSVQRPRELLSRLVLAGPRGLAQEELAAHFWPDSEPKQALNSLYVSLHRLRHGTLGDPDAVVSDAGRVRLNPARVRVDAWEFLRLAAKPQQASDQSLLMALDFYDGEPQLYGVDEVDLEIWRHQLVDTYEAAIAELAARAEQRDWQAALALYRQGLLHVPLSELLWSGVLRCEAALGDQLALRRSYKLIYKRYQSETDLTPPATLIKLYEQLKLGFTQQDGDLAATETPEDKPPRVNP